VTGERCVRFKSACACTPGGRLTDDEFSHSRNKTFDSSVDADAIIDSLAGTVYFPSANAVCIVSSFPYRSWAVYRQSHTSCCHIVFQLPGWVALRVLFFMSYLMLFQFSSLTDTERDKRLKRCKTRRMVIANGTCVSFCNQPKAHFGLPWVRPWDNRGKCHMDEKRIQCLWKVS